MSNTETKPFNVLITGGCGFIGHHLCRAICHWAEYSRIKVNIVVADIEPPQYQLTPPDKNCQFSTVSFERTSASDYEAIRGLLSFYSIDVIYHLAAYFGGMTILESEEHMIVSTNSRINNVMAEAVMSHAELHDKRVRFFFSSSQCVYQDQMPGDAPWSESDAWKGPAPNLYGAEKRLAENVFLAMSRHAPVDVVIGRFGNCYGPESQYNNKQAKAPAALCWKAFNAPDYGDLEIYGNGSAIRSYIYVDDLVDGILRVCHPALDTPHTYGEIFNISSEEYVTVRALAGKVISVTSKWLQIKSVPGPIGNHARYVSCQKLREFTGWECQTRLLDGIRNLYDWIKSRHEKEASAGTV